MINISTNKHLDIVTPNINKALAHVLKDASPKELELINNSKDLKSIMSTIFKQSNSSNDKALLQLVKNNPTLKNLGDTSNTLKDLLLAMKTDKPLAVEKTLKNFLIDIKDIKQGNLKQKLDNSGVFLESKLKDVKNPQIELKNILLSLAKELQTAKEPTTKAILSQTKELLNNPTLKSASSQDIVKDIKTFPPLLEKLSSEVNSIISKLKISILKADSIVSPALDKALAKLETLLKAENLPALKASPLQASLKEVSAELSKSLTAESRTILNSLEKIISSLKTLNETLPLKSKKIPNDVKKVTAFIKEVIQKADPVFSKQTTLLLNKLEALSSPQQLNPQNSVKEIISNDFKAIILQATDEVVKSSHPNQTEILKHLDKLSLQIDHQQLLSHLSNASSLYLPFSWDMLKEGNIELKRDNKDKFYCDIDLNLEEYGEVKLKLSIYDKNQLNIHIYSQNREFQELVKESLPTLRLALVEADINPREIRVLELNKQAPVSAYETPSDNLYMGFEVKV